MTTIPHPEGLGTGKIQRLTDEVAIQDFPSAPEYNHVLWWHFCQGRWVPSGLGKHRRTGSVGLGDITVFPSILCNTCGRHGFIENLTWREA